MALSNTPTIMLTGQGIASRLNTESELSGIGNAVASVDASDRRRLPVIAAGEGTDVPQRFDTAPFMHVSDLTPDEAADRLPSFCGEWPFPSSDLDLVLPEHNAEVHRARGCCRGGD